MEFLRELLFESVLYWGVFSFLLFAAVLLTRARSSGAYRRYSLPGVLGLIVLLFLMQKAVTTQRERILLSLDDFIAAITEEKPRAIADAISRNYDAEELTHDEVVAAIERALSDLDIYDVRYRRRDITIDGNSAELILGVMATVRMGNEPGAIHSGRWCIAWAREADRWRIVSIKPEMIDTIPIERFRSLLRHYQNHP